MKRNILYIAAVAYLTLGFSSCSDDPLEATSKHVYGENENPYLRTNIAATINKTCDFTMGSIAPQTFYVQSFAEQIQTNLKMTVDDMFKALETGNVVFYNINISKNAWDKTAPTKGTTGWYYNSAGGVCSEADAVACVELDKENHTIIVGAPDNAPSVSGLAINVGFAINNGQNLDDYVRFSFSVSIIDRSLEEIEIPAGDSYETIEISYSKYAEEISSVFGLNVDEFNEKMMSDDCPYKLYLVNSDGTWNKSISYNVNGYGGYWCNASGGQTTWGAEDAAYFIEIHDGQIGIGTKPENVESGTVFKIQFVIADTTDESKYIQFAFNATKG